MHTAAVRAISAAALPHLSDEARAHARHDGDRSASGMSDMSAIVTARDVSALAGAVPVEILSDFGAGGGNRKARRTSYLRGVASTRAESGLL
jgi:hypothetical protein